MDEYICRFHMLIEMSRKIDAQEALEMIQVNNLPNYKKDVISKIMSNYEKMASLESTQSGEHIISKLRKRKYRSLS